MVKTPVSAQPAVKPEPSLWTVDLCGDDGRSCMKVAALGVSKAEAQRIRDRISYRHPDWNLVIKPLEGSIFS